MIKLKVSGMFFFVAMLTMFYIATTTNAATLLFEDTFSDMSHLSVGSLDSGVATFSVVASPDEKEGTSLQASYDGVGGPSWVHRTHDLGGTALPTSGIVTFKWSFLISGAIDETRMTFLSDPSSHVPQPLGIVGSRSTDTLGLWSNMDWAIPFTSGDAWGPIELDKWNTVAFVVDLDEVDTAANVETYLAQGLTVTTDDYWATCGWDFSEFAYNNWQYYEYGLPDTGAWDTYIDDLAIYSGVAVEAGLQIPGDANMDKIVNHEDAAALAANWLSTGVGWSEGDFNDDGTVNDIDATILAANWQVTATGSTSVPEPGCLMLVLTAFASLLMLHRR